MGKHIVVIDGHPDPDERRLCHALAAVYARGAEAGGHTVEPVVLAALDFPLLRTRREWEDGALPASLRQAQEAIGRADHLVLIYPLWLGSMPALTKAFLEQVLRPGFAIDPGRRSLRPGLLRGKSARIVVTMGMPALVYRWFFLAHSLRSLERNILKFSGIGPIRTTLIGSVEGPAKTARAWLERIGALGRDGQ